MSGNCCVCSLPLGGKFIGMGDGSMKDGGKFAHAECYYRTLLATSQRELAEARAEHAKQIADMATRFRAVNIERVIEATGHDILAMRDRLEAAEARATASERQVEAMEKAMRFIQLQAKDRSEKAWFRLEMIADEAHASLQKGNPDA